MARIVVETRTITSALHSITMQLERVPCGPGCGRCPHGPYWYAYWKQDGRTRTAYVGKKCDAAKARAAVANVKNGKRPAATEPPRAGQH